MREAPSSKLDGTGEEDREMNYRNARLANGFLSLDKLAGEVDLMKSRVVSDGGAGIERMVGDIDRRPGDAEREERNATAERRRKIHAAVVKLYRAGQGYLVPTLVLICRNGQYREVSIREIAARRRIDWNAAERLYFSHRKKIENFFLGQ